jgi:hypothetical protein
VFPENWQKNAENTDQTFIPIEPQFLKQQKPIFCTDFVQTFQMNSVFRGTFIEKLVRHVHKTYRVLKRKILKFSATLKFTLSYLDTRNLVVNAVAVRKIGSLVCLNSLNSNLFNKLKMRGKVEISFFLLSAGMFGVVGSSVQVLFIPFS